MPPLSPKFQNPGFLRTQTTHPPQLESVQSNDAAYVAAKADRFRNFDLEAKNVQMDGSDGPDLRWMAGSGRGNPVWILHGIVKVCHYFHRGMVINSIP